MNKKKGKKAAKARKITKDQKTRNQQDKWAKEEKLQNFLNKYKKEILECINWINNPALYIWNGLVNFDGSLQMSKERMSPSWELKRFEREELKTHLLAIGVPQKWFDTIETQIQKSEKIIENLPV